MRGVLLSDLVRTSEAVSLASGRRVKIDEIAGLLRRAAPDEISVAVAFLSGELRQRQIGVGYAALGGLLRAPAPAAPGPAGTDPAAAGPATSGPAVTDPPATGMAGTGAHGPDAAAGTLTLAGTDSVFAAIGATVGPGSQAERRRLLGILFGRATPAERSFLTRLLAGELHQGALEGVMIEAVARAAGVDAGEVRRAHLLGGSLPAVAEAALSAASAAREDEAARDDAAAVAALAALRAFRLEVGRPLRPMLAASAPDVVTAFERMSPAAVEWKIDGIRIQVHRRGPEVRVFTRTLDDITARLPEITRAVLASPAQDLVLDGEAIALGPGGRARPFQVTASRAGTQAAPGQEGPDVPLTPFFFDLLHLDGRDLLDEPLELRLDLLAELLAGEQHAALRMPGRRRPSPAEAAGVLDEALAAGHEGVVVKALDARYAAGRRGKAWQKVKPVHTLDLVVLAAEWGHGRRTGFLSNIHLGARDPDGGEPVMVGKTFKGMTDELLAWQTSTFPEYAVDGPSWGVRLRPALVVEIAVDGAQRSTRYPGGVALRFARVLRYRPDKTPAEADSLDAVRALL
jgi:DNA ligase-1